jgi:hypothetical protein
MKMADSNYMGNPNPEKITNIVNGIINLQNNNQDVGSDGKILKQKIENSLNFAYYVENALAGGITFNIVNIQEIRIAHIILLGVKLNFRKKMIGTELLQFVRMNFSKKMVVWADLGSVMFYESLGFTQQSKIGFEHQSLFGSYDYSKFYMIGFTKNEKKLLRDC